MSGEALLVVAIAVFVAAFIQALSGFGFGLLSVPLMTLSLDTSDAIVVSTVIGTVICAYQAWQDRAMADRGLVKRMTIAAHVGMPFGLWVFVSIDDDALRLMLGIAVLIAVGILIKGVNVANVGPRFDIGIGLVAGVLNTSLGTPGPPLVVGLQARELEPDRFRATIYAVFALISPLAVVLFVAAGEVTGDGLIGSAIALPALFAGQFAGVPLRRFVDPARFRVLVLVLLVIAAMSAIIGSLG